VWQDPEIGNAVPIVSVIAGAAVAILVPLITAAVQFGEKRREHRRERLARRREVLVKCCFELAEVSTAAVNAARRVGVDWPIEVEVAGADDPKSSYRLFRERLLANYRTNLVLMLELGPEHEVSGAFSSAAESLIKVQRPLIDARDAETAEAARTTISEELDAYYKAQSDFHRKASSLLVEEEQRDERVLPRPWARRARAKAA
jgi:hypothetical protein